MKIACVDRTAGDRLGLQKVISEAFSSSREIIGHLSAFEFVPTSKEELLIGGFNPKDSPSSSKWGGIVLGSKFSFDELLGVATELRDTCQGVPLFCFVVSENYTLRNLRRLERLSIEVFRIDEPSTRVVHTILRLASVSSRRPSGKLITFEGAKGGQGCTSLVAGIAHATAALNKKAVVVDLSKEGSLFYYLQLERWQSSEYRALLVDRLNASEAMIDRLIIEAPNGINLLLPPAGGVEIRDLWMRNPQSLEISIAIVEMLKDRFDVVLVDLSHAEGLLPFSLTTRADSRVVIASNEPAAIHLLGDKLGALRDLPIEARTIVLLNFLAEHSLGLDDIEDYLLSHDVAESIELSTIKFDLKGSTWVGTGNSIYTEGSVGIKSQLKTLARSIADGSRISLSAETTEDSSIFTLIQKFIEKKRYRRSKQLLLAGPERADSEGINFVLTDELKSSFKSVASFRQKDPRCLEDSFEEYQAPTVSRVRASGG